MLDAVARVKPALTLSNTTAHVLNYHRQIGHCLCGNVAHPIRLCILGSEVSSRTFADSLSTIKHF